MPVISTKDVKPGDTVWRKPYRYGSRSLNPVAHVAVAVAASGRIAVRTSRDTGRPVYDDEQTFATYEACRADIIAVAQKNVATEQQRLAYAEESLASALAIPETPPEVTG